MPKSGRVETIEDSPGCPPPGTLAEQLSYERSMPVESSAQDAPNPSIQRESARERRNRELDLLKRQGVPIVAVSKWQLRIGPLCIWPYSGRWLNKATDSRGKLKSISMRDLIVREVPEIQISNPAAPKRVYAHRTTKDAEADCLLALERFVAEAQEFCDTLHRFRQGDQNASDQLELCVKRDRENEAYAMYRRARKRLLKSAGFSFISETG